MDRNTPGHPLSNSLHPPLSSPALDPAELQEGLTEAARLLRGFYDGLEERRVLPSTPVTELAREFEGTLGEDGVGLRRALADVEEHVLPHVMAVPHPLYLGLLNSSPFAGGIVAESIIGGVNNNGGAWRQGPPFVAAEQEVVRCFRELLGLSAESSGIVLPGGSYTSLHALQLARDSRLPAWREHGARALEGDPRVYVSDASHFSAVRAAQAVGVAPRDIVRVPTVGRGRIDPEALRSVLRADRARGALPFALVATLGTTGTGAMDALPELVEVCREYGLWLHVDACYGGAAALLEELSERFDGLAEADSVAVDPHKWFFVPMVAGLLFTRHPELELEVFDVNASYIPTGDLLDGFRRGLPTSRRAAGFAIWMMLRTHGLSTVRAAVRRNIELIRRLEAQLVKEGFRVLEGGELSIACARWEPGTVSDAGAGAGAGAVSGTGTNSGAGSGASSGAENDAFQERIAAAVVESGTAWFGTVRAQGESWLRFALVSAHTSEEHIDALARQLGETARRLG